MRCTIRVLFCALVSSGAVLLAQSSDFEVLDHNKSRIIPGREARDSVRAEATLGKGPRSNGSGNGQSGLPAWAYQVMATQDGRTYAGRILGASPLASPQSTTTIPVVIIPVVINITQGGQTLSFDPTAADPACLNSNSALTLTLNSPLFQTTNFTFNNINAGDTQYSDAFLRAEFGLTATNYHVLLSPVTTAAPLTVSVHAGARGSAAAEVYSVGPQCGGGGDAIVNPAGDLAVVNINTVDSLLQAYISANGLGPNEFPFFVTYNAVLSQGSAKNLNNCCVLGYHNALSNGQTYGIAEFEGRDQTVFSGVSDVAAASHEINEWVNDPMGTNPTPAWGNVGQVSGCRNNLEVGDPITGSLLTPVNHGGFSYHLQELAYFSWFYGTKSPDGKYSNNGTFTGPAKLCPPGGTN